MGLGEYLRFDEAGNLFVDVPEGISKPVDLPIFWADKDRPCATQARLLQGLTAMQSTCSPTLT